MIGKDLIDFDYYTICKCGAITFLKGTNSYSMTRKTKKKLGIDLRKIKRLLDFTTYNCNHCINHYGIDLCECGSGKEVEKCECGCNKTMQILGESTDFFYKTVQNFTRR